MDNLARSLNSNRGSDLQGWSKLVVWNAFSIIWKFREWENRLKLAPKWSFCSISGRKGRCLKQKVFTLRRLGLHLLKIAKMLKA